MGVNGLWQVLHPCARPTNLAQLNRKRLAVDASIWIYQFLKAVRDKEGHALRSSHVVGFFRRICKLLWFGILPVFVFDGGAPLLKRQTIQGRKQRREGRREDAVRTAGRLLAMQMQRAAEREVEGMRKRRERKKLEEEAEVIPDVTDLVYADEVGMSAQERNRSRKFRKEDAYHLPELGEGGIAGGARTDDPRILTPAQLVEYAREFNAGENINLYDFCNIDFDGDFFQSLPPTDRYNILNTARLRSRLRMGLSKEQLEIMFPDRMAFSRFQIERVRERNHLTQRLMKEMGMTGTDLTVSGGRIAGERDREYVLVKNDGAEGGWALGVINKHGDIGKKERPIDVDAVQFTFQDKNEDSGDNEDFEDVPIEGLNRLPKLTPAQQIAAQRKKYYEDRRREREGGGRGDVGIEEEFLFVGGEDVTADKEMDLDRDDDLTRAIAMSLETQYGVRSGHLEADVSEDKEPKEAPRWTQRAVDEPRPVKTTDGKIAAHIFNSRSNAAVPRPATNKEDDSDGDSDGDLQKALAASRKARKTQPKPALPSSFDGNLPFPKLDWSSSFLAKKPITKRVSRPVPRPGLTPGAILETDLISRAALAPVQPPSTAAESLPADSFDDDMGGGFEVLAQDKSNLKPLPPWLMNDDVDIRDKIRMARETESKAAAADRAQAEAEAAVWTRRTKENDIIELDSDDENDFNSGILDDPPDPPEQTQDAGGAKLTEAESAHAQEPQKEPRPGCETGHDREVRREEEDVKTINSSTDTERHQQAKPQSLPETESLASLRTADESGYLQEPTLNAQATHDDFDMDDGDDDGDGDDEFEDVPMLAPAAAHSPMETITIPDNDGLTEDIMEATIADAEKVGDDLELPPGDDDDFSDPEDAELLEQMVQEVEEHARFTSELNNRVEEDVDLREAAFAAELKALRGQQKKDRRDADDVSQAMITECQSLLRLFGIPYIIAPMEAEAQCAELVRLGLVDGIVTDDSDTFLFGGTRVYKNMFNNNKYVECYLGSEIEKELSLPRDRLISLALLLGSDYTDGLAGVGPVSAVEILSEFPGGLVEFRDWVSEVQTHQRPKEADAASPFRRKFRRSQTTKLAIPNGFPSPAVRDAYLSPEVDSGPQPFRWGVPDVEGLRLFLMATVGWDRERTDEILVPVVRDMNRRERDGTQTNITRFFGGSVGVGAKGDGGSVLERVKKAGGSRRMANAVERMRAGDRGEALAQKASEKGNNEDNGVATGKRKRAAVGTAARKRNAKKDAAKTTG